MEIGNCFGYSKSYMGLQYSLQRAMRFPYVTNAKVGQDHQMKEIEGRPTRSQEGPDVRAP